MAKPTITQEYIAGRERVLGRRFGAHDDPAIAAEFAASHHGGIERALVWARQLVAELEKRRRKAA